MKTQVTYNAIKPTTDQVRSESTAWDLRTKDAPKLNPETQPFLTKWAKKLGITDAL